MRKRLTLHCECGAPNAFIKYQLGKKESTDICIKCSQVLKQPKPKTLILKRKGLR